MRVRECERVCACVHACVRDVFAIFDSDILPRLIMIIIKIIILYFIQIRHTDDFFFKRRPVRPVGQTGGCDVRVS